MERDQGELNRIIRKHLTHLLIKDEGRPIKRSYRTEVVGAIGRSKLK